MLHHLQPLYLFSLLFALTLNRPFIADFFQHSVMSSPMAWHYRQCFIISMSVVGMLNTIQSVMKGV